MLAGKRFGIPLRGTHAHSWIMAFDSEKEAFEAWAEAMPNNCVFLVDTYDTLQGVRLAAKAGEGLRERGHELAGVRLDSGDLAELSVAARQLLDASGFPKAEIVASNDLDEHAIEELKRRGAAISVWGVGTRLATAHDDPALGGVFKLGALRDEAGRWSYPIKHSADPEKSTLPGIHQTRRFLRGRDFLRDLIFDEELGTDQSDEPHEDILGPVLRSGRLVEEPPTLDESRARALDQIARLPRRHETPRRPRPLSGGDRRAPRGPHADVRALILVDLQNDFLLGGSLAVPDGNAVIDIANAVQPRFPLIVCTQDWHPADHLSFASQHPGRRPGDQIELAGLAQTLWPDHCVQDTRGAEFAPGLDRQRVEAVFQKGTDRQVDSYSAFSTTPTAATPGLATSSWIEASTKSGCSDWPPTTAFASPPTTRCRSASAHT